MNTARGPAVPNSLFVWKVRLWLLALGVALVVNEQPAPQGLQARARADLVACSEPPPAGQLMQAASHVPQAKNCPRRDQPTDPADL